MVQLDKSGRRFSIRLHLRSLRPALLMVAAVALLPPLPVAAQCGTPVCTMVSSMGGMSCTVTWMNPTSMCSGGNPMMQPACVNAVGVLPMLNTAMTRWTGTARHAPSSGLPASCQIYFRPAVFAGYCSVQTSVSCSIDDVGDGLPLELMEFSVESGTDEESEPESNP